MVRKSRLAIAGLILSGVSCPVAAQQAGNAGLSPGSGGSAVLLCAAVGSFLALMAYGLREAAMARTQHAPAVCLRIFGALAVSIFAYWLAGFHLTFSVEPGGFLGAFRIWSPPDALAPGAAASDNVKWLFYLSLAAFGAAIIAGAVSERIKLWPFLFFAGAYSSIIFPVAASWVYGGGYFAYEWSFVDFGGAAVLHACAGAAALAGAVIVGPRQGKYVGGATRLSPSAALPLAAIGSGLATILWLVVMVGFLEIAEFPVTANNVSGLMINLFVSAAAGNFCSDCDHTDNL